ncbi:MAG: hypothetical protein ABH830_04460, partial [Patescibacteria group bacterium]
MKDNLLKKYINKTKKNSTLLIGSIILCSVVFLFFNFKTVNSSTVTLNPNDESILGYEDLLSKGYAIDTVDQAGNTIMKRSWIDDIKNSVLLQELWKYLNEQLPKAGSVALNSAITNALRTVAYDTATWIGSGGKGQKPLFLTESVGVYLKNIGDNTAGYFIEELGRNWSENFNLCKPSTPFIKVKIGLGLIAQERPTRPACTFSEMVNNWDQALQDPDFLNKFQDMFNPTSSDLGIALTLHTGIIEDKNLAEGNALEKLKLNQGWLSVEGLISGFRQYPPGEEQRRLDQVRAIQTGNLVKYTGFALTDAANVFLNQLGITLYNRLMDALGSESITTPYSGNYGLGDYEAGPSYGGGIEGAKERFRKLLEPNFSVRGDYNILAELTTCTDPQKAGPTNCVITENFRQAIENKLTVGQALDQGYLNREGIFGFTADGFEPPYYEAYPYRSMLILRKFRIIPVGWELAAQFIKDNSVITGTCNLGDLVACYDALDHDTYSSGGCKQGQWCRNLVDPDWVLKAPLNYCRREGPGPEIISAQVVGQGYESELAISRNDSYCADEQACIVENDDGSCKFYGYCTEERRKWDFNGQSCAPRYNTCQTYRNSQGRTVSYLENTLDYGICSADNAGCEEYKTADGVSYDNGQLNWADSLDSIYFDKDAQACDQDSEGCHEFIRTKAGSGANLLPNSGFEEDLNEVGDWDSFGTASYDAYNGLKSLALFGDLNQRIVIDAPEYDLSGEAFTLSFYTKDCEDASVWLGDGGNLKTFYSGESWQRQTISYIYSDTFLNRVEFNIRPDPDLSIDKSCKIDAIKLERGDAATAYSDYRANGLIYEKLLPEYLKDQCYEDPKNDGFYKLKTNAPYVCNNYVRECSSSE